MSEGSPSIGEMWPSMCRVECHSEFEPLSQEDLLQSEILFLGAFVLHGRREKRRSVLDPGSMVDLVCSSGRSHPDIVSTLSHMSLGVVSLYCHFSSSSWVAKNLSWKNMVNMALIRPLLPLGQNIDQVEFMWIPHRGQYCFRTADRLAFNYWEIFMVPELDLFVPIQEIKPGFVQRNKILLTLALDGTQQIHEAF
jgi:hypothetical protein